MNKFFSLLIALALISCSGKNAVTDFAAGVNDIPDLTDKKVSVLSGSIQDLMLSDLNPQAEILRFSSLAEVFASVESGKSDYCLADTVSFIGVNLAERGMKKVFSTDMISGSVAAALRFDETRLQSDFNAFLKKFTEDGRLDELTRHWTEGDIDNIDMPPFKKTEGAETVKATSIINYPFTFIKNGGYAGFEVELLQTFAQETGRNIEFQIVDFSGLFSSLASGKTDIAFCTLFITEERSKQVLFTDPYYYCNTVCCCRTESAQTGRKNVLASVKKSFYNNLIVEDRWKLVVAGLWETIIISLMSILLGTILGGFICWMKLSRSGLLKETARVYVEIIRGVPILVLLMLMFYVIFAKGSITARWVAIVAFAMNFGAYVSEMFRTGIESVDKGQREAGLAMGFTPLKTFLFFIVPQAAKKVIPVFKGEAVSLIKNTSVVGFIAIQDLTKASEIIRSRTFDAFFPLIIISIIYFLLAWLLGKLLDRLSDKIA